MICNRPWFALSLLLTLPIGVLAADNEPHGIQLGSVGGFAAAGLGYDSGTTGIHPSFGGGLDVGLSKYLGVFGEGDYTRIPEVSSLALSGLVCFCAGVKPDLVDFAGGLEVVGTNHSRLVPYAKMGMGYGRASGGFRYFADGAPAIALGGGLRAYVKSHFGIEAQVLALRYVGGHGGDATVISTFGVFLQSK